MSEHLNSDILTSNAQNRLRTIIERVERLDEDKAAIATDTKEVMIEAKGEGFDTKIIRKIIRMRAQDRAKRLEEQALVELYAEAVGGL